ncbi:hypothetical protein NL676_010952 [Syzygium grande]|nr:hypothetical protein NL676_010952 [Syzygium grande]
MRIALDSPTIMSHEQPDNMKTDRLRCKTDLPVIAIGDDEGSMGKDFNGSPQRSGCGNTGMTKNHLGHNEGYRGHTTNA